MKNEYIIQLDDYLKHIADKLKLYAMLMELATAVNEVPDCAKTEEVRSLAKIYKKAAYKMWENWGSPELFQEESDNHWLENLIESELLPLDEVI